MWSGNIIFQINLITQVHFRSTDLKIKGQSVTRSKQKHTSGSIMQLSYSIVLSYINAREREREEIRWGITCTWLHTVEVQGQRYYRLSFYYRCSSTYAAEIL
jgi:hypothetical protein